MGWESLEDKEVWRFRISQEAGVEGNRVGKVEGWELCWYPRHSPRSGWLQRNRGESY